MVDAARVQGSAPAYLHNLSMIGQFLNQQHARLATITEVNSGFLVMYFPNGDLRKQQSLTIEYTDLLELNGSFAAAARGRKNGFLRGGDARDKKHPLMPQGYDTVLRTIGFKLDRRKAVCITICETAEKIYINYWLDKSTFVIREQRRQAVSSQQQEIYSAKDLATYISGLQEAQALEAKRHKGGLQLNPYDHLSAMSAAFMYEDDGYYGEAEALYGRIIKQVPEHPEAHYHLARMALARGDKGTALGAARKAAGIRDDLAATHDLLGRVLQQQGKQKDALISFEQAVGIDPDNPILHQHLARAYEAVGRREDAEAERALVSRPHAAPAWEMVQEQMAMEGESQEPLVAARATDDSPASMALLPIIAASPAEAALLPALAEGGNEGTILPEPVLTTVFDSSMPTSWPQQSTVGAAAGLIGPTPLAAEGSTGNWPNPQPGPQHTPGQGQMPGYAPQGYAPTGPQQGYGPAVPQQGYPAAGPQQPYGPGVTQQGYPATGPQPGWPQGPQNPPPGWGAQGAQQPYPGWQQQAAQPSWQPPQGAVPPQGWQQQGPAPNWQPQGAPAQPPAWTQPQAPETPRQQPWAGAPATPAIDTSAIEALASAGASVTPQKADTGVADEASAVELAAEIMMIQRAIEAEPNRAELHRKLGFLLARQGRAAEAATEFRKALQCSRTSL